MFESSVKVVNPYAYGATGRPLGTLDHKVFEHLGTHFVKDFKTGVSTQSVIDALSDKFKPSDIRRSINNLSGQDKEKPLIQIKNDLIYPTDDFHIVNVQK